MIFIPTAALEKFANRNWHTAVSDTTKKDEAPAASLMEYMAEHCFLNGTKSMVIDMDSCTRCDDCERACASPHDGNPRFLRHGSIIDNLMIANSCMHCVDPVCMSGCPTGAIHRTSIGGEVVINPNTCIGCGACSANYPYDAIRMVEVRSKSGEFVVDEEFQPILKATNTLKFNHAVHLGKGNMPREMNCTTCHTYHKSSPFTPLTPTHKKSQD